MQSQMYFRKHHKASEGDEFPVELFQILKDDAVKLLHSICQQICKTQQWPQNRKRSVFIPVLKKGNAKECSSYCTIALISHASKVIIKISKVTMCSLDTFFPIWSQFIVPCLVLTVASWPAYRFLRRHVRWSDIPISFRIFHSLLWSTESKALA